MRSARPFIRSVLAAAALLIASAGRADAENWPHWRGPGHNGVCSEKDLPTEWDAETNVAWRTELPGPAGATPVIWGERIFLTSVDGTDLVLLCIGTDGKERWRQTVGQGSKDVRGDEGNFASPSPSTDGKHVWCLMGQGDLACYTVDGKEVWKFNVQERYGKLRIAFGLSSTPVLHGGRLYVQLIHGEGQADTQEAMVVALDAATGEEVWQVDRITGASNENEHSYASPTLYDENGLTYLITHGADFAIAYDLADGKERWRLAGLNPHDDPARRYHPTLRFVASPVANEGIVVVPTAKNGPVVALRGTASGQVTEESEAHLWTMPQNTPDVPSPLIKDGLLYLCRENGNLMCLDARSGEQHYEERTNRNRHRASPVWADGKIYLTGRDGRVTVVRAGKEFEILAANDTGEDMSASPAIADGTIYLRTFDALWAIRAK